MDRSQLQTELLLYRPCDTVEQSHRERMLDLLGRAPGCWTRSHLQPGHFTASAFVVDARERAVAMILHRRLARWLQPGGHVETSDADASAAARRELREETGIAPAGNWFLLDLDIHDIPARPGEAGHAHFDLRYALILDPGHPRPVLRPADDATGARWQPLRTLLDHAEPGLARAGRKILDRLGQSPVD